MSIVKKIMFLILFISTSLYAQYEDIENPKIKSNVYLLESFINSTDFNNLNIMSVSWEGGKVKVLNTKTNKYEAVQLGKAGGMGEVAPQLPLEMAKYASKNGFNLIEHKFSPYIMSVVSDNIKSLKNNPYFEKYLSYKEMYAHNSYDVTVYRSKTEYGYQYVLESPVCTKLFGAKIGGSTDIYAKTTVDDVKAMHGNGYSGNEENGHLVGEQNFDFAGGHTEDLVNERAEVVLGKVLSKLYKKISADAVIIHDYHLSMMIHYNKNIRPIPLGHNFRYPGTLSVNKSTNVATWDKEKQAENIAWRLGLSKEYVLKYFMLNRNNPHNFSSASLWNAMLKISWEKTGMSTTTVSPNYAKEVQMELNEIQDMYRENALYDLPKNHFDKEEMKKRIKAFYKQNFNLDLNDEEIKTLLPRPFADGFNNIKNANIFPVLNGVNDDGHARKNNKLKVFVTDPHGYRIVKDRLIVELNRILTDDENDTPEEKEYKRKMRDSAEKDLSELKKQKLSKVFIKKMSRKYNIPLNGYDFKNLETIKYLKSVVKNNPEFKNGLNFDSDNIIRMKKVKKIMRKVLLMEYFPKNPEVWDNTSSTILYGMGRNDEIQKFWSLSSSLTEELAKKDVILILQIPTNDGFKLDDPSNDDSFIKKLTRRMIEKAKESTKQGKYMALDPGYNYNAKALFAGVDLGVVTSRFEPCGLTDIESLWMGTLVLVNETGGLNKTGELAFGFKGDISDPESMKKLFLISLDKAIDMKNNNPKQWLDLQIKALNTKQFEYEVPAKAYVDLVYNAMIKQDFLNKIAELMYEVKKLDAKQKRIVQKHIKDLMNSLPQKVKDAYLEVAGMFDDKKHDASSAYLFNTSVEDLKKQMNENFDLNQQKNKRKSPLEKLRNLAGRLKNKKMKDYFEEMKSILKEINLVGCI